MCYNAARRKEEVSTMERGQRRSPQRPYRGQVQRPTQRPPQRRPVQSGRPSQPGPYRRKRRRSKRPWIIGAIVLLLLIILIGGNDDSGDRIEQNAESVTPFSEQIETTVAEPNTTAKVDQIIATAKADASGSNGASIAEGAFAWIVTTVPEWYDGPEIMEQAIYNGALVEYYYTGRDEVRSAIGEDVVQSVKYVYRGVETVLDDATQENIRQIKKGIEKDRGN